MGDKYETTLEDDKRKFLEAVEDSTDREVSIILDAFVDEVQQGSPEKKRRRKRSILNLAVTLITTPGIGYGVNLENWWIVALFSIILLSVQIYILSSE